MSKFSVDKHMKKITMIKRRISSYLLAYCRTLIIKKLKISVEHGKVVTKKYIIKH